MIEIKHKTTGEVLHRVDADSLHSADLRGAGLRDADLRYADLSGADLRGASLYGAGLRYADLRGADLRNADLRYADLRGADLRDADLRFANLRDADLCFANLRDADLCGADLRGADLRNTIYDTKPEREKLVQELIDASKDCLELLEDWFPSMDDMRCASEVDSKKIDRLKAAREALK